MGFKKMYEFKCGARKHVYSKFAIIILIIKNSLNSYNELQIQQNKSNGLSDFAITKFYCTDQNHANTIYVPVYKICYTM